MQEENKYVVLVYNTKYGIHNYLQHLYYPINSMNFQWGFLGYYSKKVNKFVHLNKATWLSIKDANELVQKIRTNKGIQGIITKLSLEKQYHVDRFNLRKSYDSNGT
jgi:hypothetical protein